MMHLKVHPKLPNAIVEVEVIHLERIWLFRHGLQQLRVVQFFLLKLLGFHQLLEMQLHCVAPLSCQPDYHRHQSSE